VRPREGVNRTSPPARTELTRRFPLRPPVGRARDAGRSGPPPRAGRTRSEIPTALASPHVRRYWATYKPGNPLGKRIFPDVNCFIIFCISLNWFSS
jgi:hypothetical protein